MSLLGRHAPDRPSLLVSLSPTRSATERAPRGARAARWSWGHWSRWILTARSLFATGVLLSVQLAPAPSPSPSPSSSPAATPTRRTEPEISVPPPPYCCPYQYPYCTLSLTRRIPHPPSHCCPNPCPYCTPPPSLLSPLPVSLRYTPSLSPHRGVAARITREAHDLQVSTAPYGRQLSLQQPTNGSKGGETSPRRGGIVCPPPPLTKWTRRVPHPVPIGHAASLTPH